MHISSNFPPGILVDLRTYVGHYRFSIHLHSWLAILLVRRRRVATDLGRGFELAEMLELVWAPSFEVTRCF